MLNLGPWEVGLILVVALIVVGPGKLPEVAKAIGKSMNEFKKATAGYKRDFQEVINSIEDTVKETEKSNQVGKGEEKAGTEANGPPAEETIAGEAAPGPKD